MIFLKAIWLWGDYPELGFGNKLLLTCVWTTRAILNIVDNSLPCLILRDNVCTCYNKTRGSYYMQIEISICHSKHSKKIILGSLC